MVSVYIRTHMQVQHSERLGLQCEAELWQNPKPRRHPAADRHRCLHRRAEHVRRFMWLIWCQASRWKPRALACSSKIGLLPFPKAGRAARLFKLSHLYTTYLMSSFSAPSSDHFFIPLCSSPQTCLILREVQTAGTAGLWCWGSTAGPCDPCLPCPLPAFCLQKNFSFSD